MFEARACSPGFVDIFLGQVGNDNEIKLLRLIKVISLREQPKQKQNLIPNMRHSLKRT